jgi:glycosyltransferase involved in cell wall biosynthesis
MNKIQIHQIHPAVSYGDAIGNDMVDIQSVLRKLGYNSNIYAQYIHPKMHGVKNYVEYKKNSSSKNILIMHYSIGYGSDLFAFVKSLPDKKILIYHNITPPEYYRDINSEYEYHIKIGREELIDLGNMVELALGDSELNRQELVKLGFKNTGVLPIVIEFNKYKVNGNQKIIRKYNDSLVNILFVGRVSPNKKIEDVIKCFYYYNKSINQNSRLFIVGSYDGMDKYYDKLKLLANKLNLKKVYFTGHVSFEELISYYKLADIFITMSEHEGFCVPLLECMYFKIPIIAYNSTAIPYTLKNAGILVNNKVYEEIAEMMNLLVEDDELRRKVVKKQTERLKNFSGEKVEELLKDYLEQFCENKTKELNVQIEGTFEDSYSLSIVNRNLALAMDKIGCNVSLFATTGWGDYTPPNGSITDKKVKELWSKKIQDPEFVIRYIYPPRIGDLRGKYKLIIFSWEESLIPNDWVADFNSLDGIIVPSNFVKKVLADSGVENRIEIIPHGVNINLFSSDLKPMKVNTKKKFIFLNVGSGFPRKGIDVLIKAYTEEFSKDDAVCLVLKTFPNIHNKVSELINTFTKQNSPEIIHIDRDISETELVSLHKRCNCFVTSTRGEGFGLPIAEAMLCKMPVIATNHGGHLDFCDEENSYLINFELVPSKSHLKVEHAIPGSTWAEPDVQHLKQLMRHVYENRDSVEIKEKVEKAYSNIINNFSWDAAAKKTIAFLEKIKLKARLGLVSTWNTKCGVAEYTKYLIEQLSDKTDFTLLANYEISNKLIRKDKPNVIRCWDTYFDNLNRLYQEIKERELNIVHFQFNFGFFELKALMTLIKKLKMANIKSVITFHSVDETNVMGKKVRLEDIKEDLKLVDEIWVHTANDVIKLSLMGINENVIQIPHGNKVFPNIEKETIREGIFSNSKIISTFGFFLPHKGILETIIALSKLIKKYPDMLFLVVSSLYPDTISKKYYEQCKRKVENRCLKRNVLFFTDYLEEDEIIELLQASDIVVMPYKGTKESSSAAIRFALASHRPVIATNAQIFDDLRNEVYTIENCSFESIAKGIMDLIDNKILQQNLITNSQKKIESQSWANIATVYEKRIQELVCA